ncbi:hypothetical protein LTS08_005336 [Lithohypha guttulata]|uniref:uncharacterized protein n=1 Tax=Lithohypha guttulata TaxID=1690604 RepID=UPI002DDDD618|nr:hypothetical protein LTR51_004970 [Lithohypha guttulata]KAK5100585.1 hypothetical protein LTS08_005336 [Lithohypha guttulata]
MSLDRATIATTSSTIYTGNTAQQYATFADTPSTHRSYNTMASPKEPVSQFVSKAQIYSLSIPKAWESPLAGAGAGLASGIVTCPLDVIKTKLQAQGGFSGSTRISSNRAAQQIYHGIVGSATTIVKEEGFKGLYRGLGPMLLGYLPTWAVYLTIYEKSRQPYYEMCENWWLARCYASLTAGACSTLLTNPIWVIKTRLMSQSNRSTSEGRRIGFHYKNTWDAARQMYKAEGFRSFYSGLTPAMLGLTHVAVQFPLYEFFKTQFTGYGIGEHPADEKGSTWVGITAATFLSKTCASTATYPHEVLRTRLQTQQRRYNMTNTDGMKMANKYNGFVQTCKIMLKEEGWRGFYAGLGTNLIRAIPSAMTTMLTYEFLQRTIHNLKDGGEAQLNDKQAFPR